MKVLVSEPDALLNMLKELFVLFCYFLPFKQVSVYLYPFDRKPAEALRTK